MSVESNNLDALAERLEQVERIQRLNLPKLRNVLKRLAAMEKSMASSVTAIAELKTLAQQDKEIRAKNAILLASNADKLDNILGFMSHARSVGGFARRHGPRAVAFGVGLLVASGKLTPEWAQKILHLFGL